MLSKKSFFKNLENDQKKKKKHLEAFIQDNLWYLSNKTKQNSRSLCTLSGAFPSSFLSPKSMVWEFYLGKPWALAVCYSDGGSWLYVMQIIENSIPKSMLKTKQHKSYWQVVGKTNITARLYSWYDWRK